ncbi:MAG: Rab family GTPase [Promethearchaeota archaeon]
MQKEMAYKICIFGESCVGKTTLARRYLTGYFEEDIKLTMGAELFIKFLEIESIRIVLQIWDFGGEKTFQFLLPMYSKGSFGGIFMFDLTRDETLNRIEEWLGCFKEGLSLERKGVPIILIGGKLDLQDQIVVSKQKAKKIAHQYNLFDYIECSSKSGENVEIIFENLVRKILKSYSLI